MRTILVTGATGHQGHAVICSLLRENAAQGDQHKHFKILATTRDPDSPRATALLRKGGGRVEVVRCNLNDANEVNGLFTKCGPHSGKIWGVFCALVFPGPGKSAVGEERQGKTLIDAAIKHGVSHFVYSSVDRGGEARDDTFTLDKAAKVAIERYLKKRTGEEGSMSWTILRPGFFMTNFVGSAGKIAAAVVREGLKPSTKLELVAVEDIGEFARVVFHDPQKYSSRCVVLGAECLTAAERDASYARAMTPHNTDKNVSKKDKPKNKQLPSASGILARALIRWNGFTRDLCKEFEQAYTAHMEMNNGDPEAHLREFREALTSPDGQPLWTTFEIFCARNFRGGRLYRKENKEDFEAHGVGKDLEGIVATGALSQEQA
ncbi:SubName: Full=Uncharacterized protein {ECO:0000313/EMBL:CCA69778.1} [Serendipita indica DSM 11827]|uniref:NmrA-like domain-containing protein n=1 Tax=Serendipita indica (strain DSM 11827) TaxID=1109443 RepID=G4TEN9_SERID|nr:SubName: Full=Uncharacterized protein {ECO:0000313/EMBL:CCA69778.1} [Serendipita indica DSM 11827]CCA69778.1 hypothetical protein PIIN_03718 [Serendipita indica DSM 11827]